MHIEDSHEFGVAEKVTKALAQGSHLLSIVFPSGTFKLWCGEWDGFNPLISLQKVKEEIFFWLQAKIMKLGRLWNNGMLSHPYLLLWTGTAHAHSPACFVNKIKNNSTIELTRIVE